MDGATPFPGADLARDWPVLAAALARRDPAAAQALWREGIARDVPPVRPLVATAAAQIASRLPAAESAAWAEEAGPLAQKAVEEAVARLDPERLGLPMWPRAADTLFPAAPGGREGTNELAAMLSREAAALRLLGAPSAAADDEETALRDMLAGRVWNDGFLLFATPDGGQADLSPCGLFPLLLGGMDDGERAAALERAADVFADTGAWTAEGAVVFALLADGGPFAEAAERRLRPVGHPWEEAWAMLATGKAAARRAAAKRVAWIGGGMAAALAAAALWAGGRTGGGETAAEEAAKELCREGRHEAAAAAYAAMGGAYGTFREAGEWLHAGEPAKAEPLYRALLAAGEGGDSVRMNLALALHRAGKTQEALDAYRAIAEGGGPAAHAAAKAADILEDLLALAP